MKLIVTEKDSAAAKIAQILGGHVETKEHGRGRQRVKSYAFEWDGAPAVAVGLRGHVMETTFPNTYRRWSLKHLDEMIREPDLAWVIDGASASTVAALRSVAKGATEIIVATDYDREGELIGEEALRILRGDALRRHPHDKPEKPARTAAKKTTTRSRRAPVAPPVLLDGDDGSAHIKAVVAPAIVDRHHRARYSALTPGEVKEAFSKLGTLDFKLADAAHTRQDIDLIWGAVLTRFMSLASFRYGSDYLSIGRVQTPTLRLIVDRELERRAFVPVPYWEIKAELEAASGERFTVDHSSGRFAAQADADGGARRLPGRHRRGHRLRHDAAHAGAAGAVQHHGADERRLGRRHRPVAGHEGGRVAVPRRSHQLPAYRQHRLPAVARPARGAQGHDEAQAGGRRRRRAGRAGRAQAHARQEAHHRPSADLPGRRAQGRAPTATRRASTTSSCGASWPRCCRRP